MSNPSIGSIDPTNISDFWSQTQSDGDDPANSPFAPRRPRLVPGGPPLELNDSSIGDAPGFLAGFPRGTADSVEKEDIERLEASLRQLKRRYSTDFIRSHFEPRPLPWLRHGSAADFSNAPPQPATTGGRQTTVRGPFPTVIAVLIAGVVTASAGYLGATNGQARHGIAGEPKLAAVEPQATILPAARAPRTRPAEYQTAAIGAWIASTDEISTGEGVAPATAIASLPAATNEETVMLASRSEVQTEPTAPPARRLGPADVQLLVDQGHQLAAAGDLAAARVVLARAAGAGDPGAALALGGTYDPAVLKQSGALGITGDPGKARSWYQKARDFGSLEAAGRLDRLATR